MIRHYYLNRNAQSYPEDGEHELHVDGCPTPPDWANRLSVGWHDTCTEAKRAARRQYPGWSIDGCGHCLPECHTK